MKTGPSDRGAADRNSQGGRPYGNVLIPRSDAKHRVSKSLPRACRGDDPEDAAVGAHWNALRDASPAAPLLLHEGGGRQLRGSVVRLLQWLLVLVLDQRDAGYADVIVEDGESDRR